MAVALYARVSTPRQAEKGLSIPDQLRQMREHCKAQNLPVAFEYIEPGATATDDRRPVFQQMIADAGQDPAPYEAIIVHSRSRFFRDLFEFLGYERRLKRAGVRVISITQQTADDPAGEMASKIFSLFDEYQSKENGKRTLRAMQENARQGFCNGSRPHFGFRAVEATALGNKGQRKKRPAVDADEAQIVRRIFELYLRGDQGASMGCMSIAYFLNERGITRRGQRWTRSRVHEVLANQAYIGDYYFNRIDGKTNKTKPPSDWVKLAVDPIIEPAIFRRAQSRREARAPAVVAPRVVSSPTLLTGLLKCDGCGAGMTLATGKGGRYRYYKCNTRISKGLDYCTSENLPMQKLDALVLNSLADRVFTAARVRLMLESLARHAKDSGKQQQRQLETLNRDLAAVTQGMERLYEGVEQGVLKLDDTLRQRTDQLQAQRQAILTDIARLKTKATVPAHVLQQKHIDAFTRLLSAKLLDNGAFAKEYLRLLVQEIRVNKREVRITGSYAALAQAAAGNPDDFMSVPRFAPKWLADPGSKWWTGALCTTIGANREEPAATSATCGKCNSYQSIAAIDC
jgi:site-specific DNA recombinase